MKLKKFFIMSLILTVPSSLWAHGYTDWPPSRAYKCKMGINKRCGAIQYEPQSVEQHSGFPENKDFPKDGKLASGGIARFGELDEAGKDRWHKTEIPVGENVFSWHLTARHSTKNWRYYITNNDWDPNVALTRAAFEPKPFCSRYDYGAIPKADVTTTCNVPEDHIGYHVLYSVWEIGDTPNSFYQVADVLLSKNDKEQPTESVITQSTETATTQPTVTGTRQLIDSNTTFNTGSNATLNTSSNTNLNVAPVGAINSSSILDDNEVNDEHRYYEALLY